MFLTCLSNKKSPAPFAYLLLQTLFLVGFVIYCPVIANFNEYPMMAVFWLNVFITIVLYFITHLKDPGYVPIDTEHIHEREQTGPNSKKKKKGRMDSFIKHKRSTSNVRLRSESFASNGFEAKERLDINKRYLKKIQEADPTASLFSTNGAMVTNMGTEGACQLEKKNSFPSQYDEIKMLDQKEVENQVEDLEEADDNAKEEEDMVDCEPSMDVNDESIPNADKINFDSSSKHEIESMSCGGTPIKLKSKSQNESETQNKSREDIKSVNIEEQQVEQNKDGPLNKSLESKNDNEKDYGSKESGNSVEINEPKETHHQIINKGIAVSKQIVCSFVAFPEDEEDIDQKPKSKKSQEKRRSKSKKYHSFVDEESQVKQKDAPKDSLSVELINVIRSPDQVEQGKSTERQLIKPENCDNGSTQFGLNSQLHDLKLIQSTMIESSKFEDLEKQQGPELLYVERRYCTKCNVEQPLRSKHCKDCEKCVAQYDHHCPWLGTCIGEKNHFFFYWFLIFQVIEILWGEFEVFDYMFTRDYDDWGAENVGRIILAIFFSFFLLMVFSLICFHTYLAMSNLTTWESLSWYKISYLKEWHEDWGSPFSEGCFKNLRFFCCASKKQLKDWEMPKYKRHFDEQDF